MTEKALPSFLDDWEKMDAGGSIKEQIPQYNDFFNKCKKKIFPLQEVHDIISHPEKYNHTMAVIRETTTKKNNKPRIFSADRAERPGKVIGSKYRFVKS